MQLFIMCGISGIYSFTDTAESFVPCVEKSIQTLRNRGPEVQRVECTGRVVLAHARLAILDTSSAGNQPFTDASGRYTIIYNGEFYNYRDYYAELRADGVNFTSSSDTEVLLYLYIKYRQCCLEKINGFFAFAVYDSVENTLFVARDRMGIKPLYFIQTEQFFGFSSELKGILEFPFERKLNNNALFAYLQFMYVPAPMTMLQGVEKLEPGMSLFVSPNGVERNRYFSLEQSAEKKSRLSYEEAQTQLIEHLTASVQKRLISDVPLGTFLSGGIDSSVISTIASRYVDGLQTFSIGFKDNPFIDETYYARLVAKKIHSQHTEIQIDNAKLEESLFEILNNIDEPFADSSAIAVHVLCKYVKPHVTVALSGDGADEIFAGYHKHYAHYNQLQHKGLNSVVAAAYPLLKHLPQSRSNALFNVFRKVVKYAEGASMTTADVYYKWCCFASENDALALLHDTNVDVTDWKSHYFTFGENVTMNDILLADQKLVLANDMLTKVDRMSMDNSLEVRTPFLDHTFVEFVNSLPSEYKINGKMKKRILQDAFHGDLPSELYNRPKKGFEVPLYAWCKTTFHDLQESLLSKQFIEEQGIFKYDAITNLRDVATGSSPNDAPAQIWSLLVFQSWWKRYFA
ncbi:MAG: asparagine synthase (glutamine-hydrolyzing) [Bacteroidales bacterium]|nr:asparagine synthase (glutamine-hydrolyzing) [Bacteroidales bacterium]